MVMAGAAARVRLRSLAAVALLTVLAACGRIIPPGQPPVPPVAQPVVPAVANALLAGVAAGPAVTDLGLARTDALGALRSFRESCPRLVRRTDNSGLTLGADWKPA